MNLSGNFEKLVKKLLLDDRKQSSNDICITNSQEDMEIIKDFYKTFKSRKKGGKCPDYTEWLANCYMKIRKFPAITRTYLLHETILLPSNESLKADLVWMILKADGLAKRKYGKRGFSILHMAVQSQCRPDVLKVLIEAGLPLNASYSEFKVTVLHMATQNNDLEAVELLLNQPRIRVNGTCMVGRTPLHYAVDLELESMVWLLLQHGADPNCQDDVQETPFTVSLIYSNDRIGLLMLSGDSPKRINPRLKNDAGETLLDLAAQRCVSLALFQALLELYEGPRDCSWPLLLAIRNNEPSIRLGLIRALLLKGGDPRNVKKDDESLLYTAINLGSLDVVRYLLQEHRELVDVDGKPGSKVPLFVALKNSDEETLNLLLSHGARVDLIDWDESQSSLQAAIRSFETDDQQRFRVCVDLLERGAPLNHRNLYKQTALLAAMWFNRWSMREALIDLLISRGANVNTKCSDGFAPVFVAAMHGDLHLLRKLFAAGANLDVRLSDRTSIVEAIVTIHSSSDEIRNEAMKFVLENGANCKKESLAFYLAVREATNRARVTVVELMMSHGYDLNLRYKNRLPLAEAVENHKLVENDEELLVSQHLLMLLSRRIALMFARQQPIDKENLNIMFNDPNLKYDFECYVRQIAAMRQTRVWYDSPVTFFDLLDKRNDALIRCLRYENIRYVINARDEWIRRFPVYADLIMNNAFGGMNRLRMLENAQMLLQELLGNRLCHQPIEKICGYLNDKELTYLLSNNAPNQP